MYEKKEREREKINEKAKKSNIGLKIYTRKRNEIEKKAVKMRQDKI